MDGIVFDSVIHNQIIMKSGSEIQTIRFTIYKYELLIAWLTGTIGRERLRIGRGGGERMLFRRIQCFLEVAHYLSFSEAARRMFMTQQAVTRQISELEEELGVKLFVRTTRSVNLTPAGKMLRDDFEKIDRETRVAVDRVRTLGERGDPAVLTVGIFSGLPTRSFTIPLVSYLGERFPEVQIEVRLGDMVTMRNQFMDGDLDLCITTSSDWNLWPDAEITVLRRLPFISCFP